MIRQQQLELQRLQSGRPAQSQDAAGDESAVLDSRERPTSGAHQQQPMPLSGGPPPVSAGSYSRSPGFSHPRSSFDMARADFHRRSRTPSRGASPRLRATSISADSGDWVLGGRDESAFYQAETQMLVRENQMLRHRIRDLGTCRAHASACHGANAGYREAADRLLGFFDEYDGTNDTLSSLSIRHHGGRGRRSRRVGEGGVSAGQYDGDVVLLPLCGYSWS